MKRNAHLIGSLCMPNAEMAMTTAADFLNDCCTKIPDGETGDRYYWIRWQKTTFENCRDLDLVISHQKIPGYKDTINRPIYKIKEGVNHTLLDFGSLGYADEAIKSFKIFKKLKTKQIINKQIKFQVSIPTPMALVLGFVEENDQLKVEPGIVEAMKNDLAKLQSSIPTQELAIQVDVCSEVIAYDGVAEHYYGVKTPYENILDGSIKRIATICDNIDQAVEVGIHLCYGDPGHKHIIEPKDLGTSVLFANEISKTSNRIIDFIHMAVPINRSDDAYFQPLEDLKLLNDTRIILGLIHYSDGFDGSKKRLRVAKKFLNDFDVATECGFGRRPPETIPELLQIHSDLCEVD